jgi:hypothetical protein
VIGMTRLSRSLGSVDNKWQFNLAAGLADPVGMNAAERERSRLGPLNPPLDYYRSRFTRLSCEVRSSFAVSFLFIRHV